MKKILCTVICSAALSIIASQSPKGENCGEKWVSADELRIKRSSSSSSADFKAFITPAKSSSDGILKRSKRLDSQPISHNNASKDQ